MNLFDLSENLKELYENADNIDPAVFVETVESLELAIEEKAKGYVALIKQSLADIATIKEEEKRLKKIKATRENLAKGLKLKLQQALEVAGKEKIKAGLFNVSIQNNPPSLKVDDKNKVPKNYYNTPDPVINRTMLLNAVKQGEKFQGVELVQTRSIRIR